MTNDSFSPKPYLPKPFYLALEHDGFIDVKLV